MILGSEADKTGWLGFEQPPLANATMNAAAIIHKCKAAFFTNCIHSLRETDPSLLVSMRPEGAVEQTAHLGNIK